MQKSAVVSGMLLSNIQASTVTVVRFRLLAAGTETTPALLKLNPSPTLPAAKVTPLLTVPTPRPNASAASPLAGHQATMLAGGVKHASFKATSSTFATF